MKKVNGNSNVAKNSSKLQFKKMSKEERENLLIKEITNLGNYAYLYKDFKLIYYEEFKDKKNNVDEILIKFKTQQISNSILNMMREKIYEITKGYYETYILLDANSIERKIDILINIYEVI